MSVVQKWFTKVITRVCIFLLTLLQQPDKAAITCQFASMRYSRQADRACAVGPKCCSTSCHWRAAMWCHPSKTSPALVASRQWINFKIAAWLLFSRHWPANHWLWVTVWTVVQTVLTATFNSYGARQISTPHKIKTPEPMKIKVGTVDYVREMTP